MNLFALFVVAVLCIPLSVIAFSIYFIISLIAACRGHFACKNHPTSESLKEEQKRHRFHLICSGSLLVFVPLVLWGITEIVGSSVTFM